MTRYLHPTGEESTRAVYSHNIPSNVGDFDHCASELALLYVVVIASAELEVFGRMARRSPRLPLHDWPVVTAEIAAARAASSHLWFLSGEPHLYDRIQEADTRMPRLLGSVPSTMARPDPASLDSSEVPYYSNPLERLIKLHHSYGEIVTG